MDETWDHYSTLEKEHERLFETNDEEEDQNNDDIENEEKHKILISADEIIDQDDEDKMHLLTNFTIEEFEELFNTIAPILETRVHKDALISPRSKLLLTLCWCKHGETFQLLSSNFGLKLTYTHDVIINVIQRAGKVLSQKYIKWISVNQRITDFNMRLLDWPMLLGSVDATIQKINRPTVNQKEYFSGKHKTHCVKVQGFVSPTGLLIHYTNSVPGSVHDFNLFKTSGLKELIIDENQRCQQLFGSNATTLADAGYQGISKIVPVSVTPHKKLHNDNLIHQQKLFNQSISHRRILIENWFGRLKILWNIMYECYKLRLTFYDDLWMFCASLTNFHIMKHPLRSEEVEEEEEEEAPDD